MIRMIPSRSAGQAKDYFTDALAKSDYYLNDQELNGRLQGRLADRLDIAGPASKDVFFALCENRHPVLGHSLTPRNKDNRTTGYDINFHCPKSVSIVHVLSKDNHIMDAFHASVTETMQDIEADAKTRVRKDGRDDDRETGELVWVDFIHQTARPVKEFDPDPHLHAHCYTFNMTWDEQEQRIKAGQFRDINRDMPYYQSLFHKRLSDRLMGLGYKIRRTDKSFEIEGVPQDVIDLFSKRTNEIGQVAKEKGITDARKLAELGAKTRSRKQKGLTMEELKAGWRSQIMEMGEPPDHTIRKEPRPELPSMTPERCIDHAVKHGFERASVMPYRRLLALGYRHGIGHGDVSAQAITQQLQEDRRIIHVREKNRMFCTTKEVLQEEKRMVQLARAGRGALKPLYREAPDIDLAGQQAEAVRHVLTTSDMVSIIRGAAGAGKTTLMQQAVSLIEKAGKEVTVVAPTAQASRSLLRSEGFQQAETVAKLLTDKTMQDKLDNQVLWVDEAGLLGTKDMTALLALAQKKNARLILGGDTRQHASVIRGDALRILNTVGGLRTAEVSRIYRQKNEQYRKAVEDLSDGKIRSGFERLDSIHAIKSIDPLDPHTELARDYVGTVKKGKSGLIISPTHAHGEATTNTIRQELRRAGMLGKKELMVSRLSNLNLTDAEKADWRNFKPGQRVQFNQNMKGIRRGSLWEITDVSDKAIHIRDQDGRIIPLPDQGSGKYDVLQEDRIAVAKGDRIRITRNGFDRNKERLDNGQTLQVVSVSKKGIIRLQNPISQAEYTVDQSFGHLAHAHCVTSHSSQGKTVDEVFIAQPANTFPATDAKQFYVSVSRGRERVRIYTDDKDALLDHASKLGDRQSALELVGKQRHMDHVVQVNKEPVREIDRDKPQNIDKPISHNKEDYEPSL